MKSEEQGRAKKSNIDLSNTKESIRIRGKYYTLLEISSEDIENLKGGNWELKRMNLTKMVSTESPPIW